MRHKQALAILGTVAFCLASVLPAFSYGDDFDLPHGIEQTRIPMRARHSPLAPTGPTQEDIDRIEHYRTQIEKLYHEKDYAGAEPVYKQYVDAIERVAPGDQRLASALQNYADLLRKLHKEAEAGAAEARALAILAKPGVDANTYGLKQYKLGMTLDDFTQLPSPGDPKTVKCVCSSDRGQEVEILDDEEKVANVVQCGFWNFAVKDKVLSAQTPFKMTVAQIECTPDFKFIEDEPGKGYRLFEINVPFFSSNYDEMKEALIRKYGKPKQEQVEKVKTEMGNIFPLTNLIWDNGVSRIKLTNADGTNLGRAKLRYIHRQLFLTYAKRVNEQKDKPNSRATQDL